MKSVGRIRERASGSPLARLAITGLITVGLAASLAGCKDDASLGVLACNITVEPTEIDFGTVELGQQAIQEVTLVNQSSADCNTIDVTIEDDCAGCFVALEVPESLARGAFTTMQVRFRVVQLEPAMGTVTISNEDVLEGTAQPAAIAVKGQGSDMRRPDIEVIPEVVDFGFVPAGGIAVSSFAIRSVGTNDLLIDRIRIEPADAPYRITTSTPTPERPGVLVPMQQASVGLRATLPAASTGTVTAEVIIETNVLEEKNVPGQPGVVSIPITALANLPPVAVCGEDVNVEPRDPVELDGSMSFDQDVPPDDPLTYQWKLLTIPPGSTTQLTRARTAFPAFFADVSGRFEVELVVTDALGLESDPCVVVVEALPTNAVRIELTWDHPDSDLDLHLIQQGGAFCDCNTDVHYRDCARAPNWYPGTPGANPRLDLDDRSGFGPETIDIDGDGETRFIPDGDYRIVVHYFASNEEISNWPTSISTATIRIFVFGLLAAQASQPLENTGDVWVVGDLNWPAQSFTPDGTIFSGQECGVF